MSSLFWKDTGGSPCPFCRDLSSSWDTLATHPSYNTMCNCGLQKQPHALVRQRLMEEREEKERRYLFLLSPGLWDSGHNCLWDESPIPIPPHNTAATTPTPGVCWLLTRQEGHQNRGDFRKLWGQNQSMGLGGNGHTYLLCNKSLGAGLMVGHWQTKSGHSSCNEFASQYRPYKVP